MIDIARAGRRMIDRIFPPTEPRSISDYSGFLFLFDPERNDTLERFDANVRLGTRTTQRSKSKAHVQVLLTFAGAHSDDMITRDSRWAWDLRITATSDNTLMSVASYVLRKCEQESILVSVVPPTEETTSFTLVLALG